MFPVPRGTENKLLAQKVRKSKEIQTVPNKRYKKTK